MIGAVLFDLDGTLADTAPDLGHVLNLQLTARGMLPLPISYLRRFASMGARGLIKAGFDLDPVDEGYAALSDEFHGLYEQHLCRDTQLFPGINIVLAWLDRRDIAWGIVTNKVQRFTLPLVEHLGLAQRARSVVSGDTCSRAKPHPEPLLRASSECAVEPDRCLYVGDDERDVQAGRAAGMRVAIARYGYLGASRPPEAWGGDALIDAPTDLLSYLSGWATPEVR
jgi:2-phosphoglycolate phosphatase